MTTKELFDIFPKEYEITQELIDASPSRLSVMHCLGANMMKDILVKNNIPHLSKGWGSYWGSFILGDTPADSKEFIVVVDQSPMGIYEPCTVKLTLKDISPYTYNLLNVPTYAELVQQPVEGS